MEIKKQKYHEVFGEAFENNLFLRKICLFLAISLIFMAVLLRKEQRKPPLIIRVDEMGQAEPIKNPNRDHQLTKPEVLNFIHVFMRNLLERNFYTWEDNFVEAGKMMTPRLREQMGKQIDLDEEIAQIKSERLKSKLNLTRVDIIRETDTHLIAEIKGWRKVSSYEENEIKKETIFEAEISLQKGARTMDSPYGLLVDGYAEKVFKDN